MKTSIKTVIYAFAFLLTSAFAAHAADKGPKKSAGFKTGIYSTRTGKINVLVDKMSPDASTMLLLKDRYGNTVYKETVDRSELKFGRILDVNGLNPGTYKIAVISEGAEQSKTFELSEQKIERTIEIQ